MRRTLAVLIITGLASPLAATGAEATCTDLLVHPAPLEKGRAITASDLAGLRDIGQPEGAINGALTGYRSPLGLSPDGKRIAFIITRPDTSTNSYCIGLALMHTKAGSAPQFLD